jgi:hypothetical protein
MDKPQSGDRTIIIVGGVGIVVSVVVALWLIASAR